MSRENQIIRQQFLALACQYLFGPGAHCTAFRHAPAGAAGRQAVPADKPPRSR